MEIFPLEEGNYTFNKEKRLTLITKVNDKMDSRSIRMDIRPFLIKLKNEIVLLDCGLGTDNTGIYVNKQELEYPLSQTGNPFFNYDLLLQLSPMPNFHIMNDL